MKTLYFECNMGASGDMLMSALLELCPDKENFIEKINKIGIPHTVVSAENRLSCGIKGTHINVSVGGVEESEAMHSGGGHSYSHEYHHEHNHEHHHEHSREHRHSHCHRGMTEIEDIINNLDISDKVRADAIAVYKIIAQAESFVHQKDVAEIHFHEVGTFDAICDIVGVCMLMADIAPEKVMASPINTGSGQVQCAHGILPVPAPATELILRGIPIYSGKIKSELCTPTGAALIKYFVDEFCGMPVMTIEKTGYGIGTKQFESANCLRAFLGETGDDKKGEIIQLSTNIDDMTGEEIAFAMERLMAVGCLDVFCENILMKKGRPAILLNAITAAVNKEEVVKTIFKHTSTIGIREFAVKRHTLDRCIKKADTIYGEVNCKVSQGYGVKRVKAEYEDIAELARQNDVSLRSLKIDSDCSE